MRRVAVLLCVAMACHKAEIRSFDVGEQHLEAAVPHGWEALDRGRQIVFRSESAEMILADLGPCRPEGFRREIAVVRNLSRSGRDHEARTRLGELRLPPELHVEPQLDALEAAIDGMQPASMERIADDALKLLGHDQRREVKSRQALRVDGREAMEVETWMALTHGDPARFLVVINDGRTLALHCSRCDDDAFERVAKSLHFAAGSRK